MLRHVRSIHFPVVLTGITLSTFAITFATASEARADHLEACGGVWFEGLAEGSCEVVPLEQCESRCDTVSTVKVCAARLTTECDASCTAEASVECEAACSETCVNECETTTEEQPPNCMGLCMSDCQMDATAACEGDDEHGECRSSGAQCCADKCDAQCADTEETTCEPVCDTACYGSCEARANLDCQIDCQSERYTSCEETVVQECRTECETTGAAIFCEGQFLASGGDLEACADELAASFGFSLDVDIDVDVDVDVDCNGDDCDVPDVVDDDEDEDGTQLGCFSTVDPEGRQGLGWAVLAMVGIGAWRVRRATRSG